MKKMRKDWWLGFLGIFAYQGIIGVVKGDWVQALWILWLIWFIYFVPVGKK